MSEKPKIEIESPKDQARYKERIEKLVYNQEKQLKANGVSFVERIKVDNPDFEDVEELEEIYSNLEEDEVVNHVLELYGEYERYWGKKGMKNFLRTFPKERLDSYSAKTSNGNLASLEILGEDLNKMDSHKKGEVIKSLSVLRNLWYSHYGFYDLRLMASYLKYGEKQKGLDTAETVTRYIEHVSSKDSDVYCLVFAGKKQGKAFEPRKVLGHIGMIDGMEYPEDKKAEYYDPKKHVIHLDKLHLSEEGLITGRRIISEINVPVKLENVREITRYMKSPFVAAKKQVFSSALSCAVLAKRFQEKQFELQENEGDSLLILADLDERIARLTVARMDLPHSYAQEKYFTTREKEGILMPRWIKDNEKVVKTGPTVPLVFTGKDLVEKQEIDFFKHNPVNHVKKTFKLAENSFEPRRIYDFFRFMKLGMTNQMNSSESKYVRLSDNGNNGELFHTGQVGGPEGLISVEDKELAFEIARNFYSKNPNFLPLPYDRKGVDFSNLSDEVLDRVLFPLKKQNLTSIKYNLETSAQVTPLGNTYKPMLENIDTLDSKSKGKERKNQEKLIQDLLARSKFLPLIKKFLEGEMESTSKVNLMTDLISRYFKNSEIDLDDVSDLTNVENLPSLYQELFSNSLFLCAGLGTAGMHLSQDLRKSIPMADYILIDHGVVDSDNGHQIPSVNELGASKLAVAVDGMMKDVPLAPWGSKENLLGGVFGFATPYSRDLNDRVLDLIKQSGKENIVFVDGIDVSDSKTILQKMEFHRFAVKVAKELKKPVSVTCGLDLGQIGVWRGHFVYEGDSDPFYGLLNFRPGFEKRVDRIPPIVLLAPLLIRSEIPMELELLIADMARDGSMEGIGQTVYSSNQSSTHVGSSAILGSMMQSLGFKSSKMRETIRPAYLENPYEKIFNEEVYKRYSNYSGKDGLLLLPFLLYLSSQVYKSENWPKSWAILAEPKFVYNMNLLNVALST